MEDLKNLGEKLGAELKGKLDEYTKAAEERNEGKLKDIKSELETLQTRLQDEAAKTPEIQKQLDEVSTELKKAKQELGSSVKAVGQTAQQRLLKQFEADAEMFKAYKSNPMGSAPRKSFELKAVGDMTFGDNVTQTAAAAVDRTYIPGIFGNVRRRNRIRQFIPQGTMSGDAIPYVVESGSGEGTVVTVDEGTSKPQIDKDIVVRKAPAIKIAAFSRLSDEILDDLPAISSFVTTQITEDVYDKEDQQLLFGTGSGTPLQLEGLTARTGVLDATDVAGLSLTFDNVDQKVDAVIAACAALASNEYMADTILMNPEDVYDIMLLKATDDDYLKNGAQFTLDGRLLIKGIPVVETTAVTAGNFLVAEMSRAATMFQRAGLSVRFYDQDSDNATKNLITVVIEERIALAVPYEDAIFYDAFADVVAVT